MLNLSPSEWIVIARFSARPGRLNGRHTKVLQHGDQTATVDLERRPAGQLVDDEDAGRYLVRCQRGPTVLTQSFGVGYCPPAQLDSRDGNMTQSPVRYRCYGRVGD